MESVIALDAVTMEFRAGRDGRRLVLDRVTFDARAGEFVSIIGPSGCGKSTLLRIVASLLQPTAGSVRVLGKPPEEAKAQRRVGFVFQDSLLFPWRTVLENVWLPFEIGHQLSAQTRQRAVQLLEMVGLGGFEHEYPYKLSGGMRQRAAIVRALCLNPQILLMDEPFGAIDELTRERLHLELLDICRLENVTTLFVTHSIPEAVFLSDRVVVMHTSPGRVAGVIDVDLPRPRDNNVRFAAPFQGLAFAVKNLLSEGAS